MPSKNFLQFTCLGFVTLVAFSFSVLAQNKEINIPALLAEAKQKSDANWRRMLLNYPNYTYKFRKFRRETNRKNQTIETGKGNGAVICSVAPPSFTI